MSDTFISKFVNSAIMSDGGEALPVNQLINSHIWHQNMNPASVQYAARMIMRGAELGLTLDRMFRLDNAELRTLTSIGDIVVNPHVLALVLENSSAARLWAEADPDIVAPLLVAAADLNPENFPTIAAVVNSHEAIEAVLSSPKARSMAFSNTAVMLAISSSETAMNVIVGSPEFRESADFRSIFLNSSTALATIVQSAGIMDVIIRSTTLFNTLRILPNVRNAITSSSVARARLAASSRIITTQPLTVNPPNIANVIASNVAYLVNVVRGSGTSNHLTVTRTLQGSSTSASDFTTSVSAGAVNILINRFTSANNPQFTMTGGFTNVLMGMQFRYIPI